MKIKFFQALFFTTARNCN